LESILELTFTDGMDIIPHRRQDVSR
jgi:hypothetical protein